MVTEIKTPNIGHQSKENYSVKKSYNYMKLLCFKTLTSIALTAQVPALLADSTPDPRRSGGRESGGGDLASLRSYAAWFTTSTKIKACLEINSNFEVAGVRGEAARELLSEIVVKSGNTWASYTKARLKSYTKFIQDNTGDYNFSFPEGVEIQASCDVHTEVTFYFGKKTPDILEEAKQYESPLAFTKNLAIDENTGRGRGYIFVDGWSSVNMLAKDDLPNGVEVPIWSPDTIRGADRLTTVVMHEMGHLLGIPYVEGTVMRRSVQELLWLPASQALSIDHEISIAPPDVNASISGILDSFSELVDFSPTLNRFFFGPDLDLYSSASKLELKFGSPKTKRGNIITTAYLSIQSPDKRRTGELALELSPPRDFVTLQTGVFAVHKANRDFSLDVEKYSQDGIIYHEETGTKKKLDVKLVFNSAGFPSTSDNEGSRFSPQKAMFANSRLSPNFGNILSPYVIQLIQTDESPLKDFADHPIFTAGIKLKNYNGYHDRVKPWPKHPDFTVSHNCLDLAKLPEKVNVHIKVMHKDDYLSVDVNGKNIPLVPTDGLDWASPTLETITSGFTGGSALDVVEFDLYKDREGHHRIWFYDKNSELALNLRCDAVQP